MVEFDSLEGGRYTYVDDIINLQNLALAFGEIFHECDNFILKGCEVSGNSISAGYVYINGKLRRFNGASNIAEWPQYIYEANSIENVSYASGQDKVGRKVYGCNIATTAPLTLDPLTGKVPVAMKINKTGNKTFRDAFIGKYALLLNGVISQSVSGDVLFGGVKAGEVTATEAENLNTGNLKHRKYYDGNNLVFQSQNANGVKYQFIVEDGIGFSFYINGKKVVTFGADGIDLEVNMKNKSDNQSIEFGKVSITEDGIFNSTTASNGGVLGLNMVGFGGNTTYFRDTKIGNGKGNAILWVHGETGVAEVTSNLSMTGGTPNAVTLKGNVQKNSLTYRKFIEWKDSSDIMMGQVGFIGDTDQIFSINNAVSSVRVTATDFVDLGPAIKENGVLLSEKYVLKSNIEGVMSNKADATNVYDKTTADNTFASKTGGFSQFVTGSNTKTSLRNAIEAASSTDVDNCAKKNAYLSDMATDDAKKAQIRANIGAASLSDIVSQKDTGWLQCSGQSNLWVRQIGNVVSIQGVIRTVHTGSTVFTIPNTVMPPSHEVYQSVSFSNNSNWSCDIKAGQRTCKASFCNGACYNNTSFSMTYMV